MPTIPDIDQLLKEAKEANQDCSIMYGSHSQYANVGGQTVGAIRAVFRCLFNIPEQARALIKDQPVDADTILLPGQILEFRKESGHKGLGDLLTPDALMERWAINKKAYIELVDLGLPSVRLAAGVFHPEIAVDEWFRQMRGGNDSNAIRCIQQDETHDTRDFENENGADSNGIHRIESQLSDLCQLIEKNYRTTVVKEWYTVDEFAEKTGYKPWTIRQSCNKGRINGAKKDTRSQKWRIPHEVVHQIENNGLPK